MSMDKSLKSKGELTRHRNVLSRAERVEALREEGRWSDGEDVFGLPKVVHRKVQTRKHKAAAQAEKAVEAEAETATPTQAKGEDADATA